MAEESKPIEVGRGRLRAEVTLAEPAGRSGPLEPVVIRLWRSDGSPLTAKDARAFASLVADARSQHPYRKALRALVNARGYLGSDEPVSPMLQARATASLERAEARERRPGRPRKVTDDELRAVARVYNLALKAGEPPTKAVAEAFGLSDASAARRVFIARRDRFLPKTRQGKAKGNGKKAKP